MRKNKMVKCPNCQTEVPFGETECPNCKTPIGAEAEPTPPEPQKCPKCGVIVDPSIKFCGNCGADLKPEEPPEPQIEKVEEPPQPGEKKPEAVLVIETNNGQIRIEEDEVRIGRFEVKNAAKMYVAQEKYEEISRVRDDENVKRQQFTITRDPDGSFFIEDTTSVNNTYLNGVPLRGQGKKPLKDGDEIVVADFKMKLVLP